MRGDPRLYQKRGIWYADLGVIDGRHVRESLKTTDEGEAMKRLARLRKARERGLYAPPAERNVTVRELLSDLEADLRLRGVAGLGKIRSHIKTLRVELGHRQAANLDTASIRQYQQGRLDEGRAPATVNRECERLRQAFRLGARSTPPKLKTVPYVPLLTVHNARQGFLGKGDLQALLRAIIDPDVRDFLEWFAWTGMRPGEIRSLTWAAVDREAGTINLDPKDDKGRRGRVIALEGPLGAIMDRRWKARRLDTPLIFHRTSRNQPGQPVKAYTKLWRAALKTAGLPPAMRPYDLRRTALRNLIRGGTDYTVAMRISGHRTRSTFDRYNIVDEADIREAIVRTAVYVGRLPGARKVASIGGRKR